MIEYGFRQQFVKCENSLLSVPAPCWQFDKVEVSWEKRFYSTLPSLASGYFDEDGVCYYEDSNTVFKDRIFPINQLPKIFDQNYFLSNNHTIFSPVPCYEPLSHGIRIICWSENDIHLKKEIINYPFFSTKGTRTEGYLYYFYALPSYQEASDFVDSLNKLYNSNLKIIDSFDRGY